MHYDLVSVDDHIIEPPTVWVDRLPARYQEAGPHVVEDDDREYWVYEGRRGQTMGLNAVAGSEKASTREAEALGVLVEAQLAARAAARAAKDWAASDAIRDTLNHAGVVVEDGPDGATWSLKRD